MSDIVAIYALLAVLFCVGSIPLIRLFLNTKRDLFEPVYWASAYFILIFGIRSIYAMLFGTPFLGNPPFSLETVNAWIIALIYAIASFLIFLIGYYSKFGAALAKTLPLLPRHWSLTKIMLFVPLATGIGFLALSVLIIYFGGLEIFLTRKQLTLTAGGTTYLYLLVGFIQYALFIAYITALIHRKMRATALLLLAIVLIIGFASGSKGSVLFPILSFLVIRNYFKRPIQLKHLLIIALLAIFVFPFFNVYRSLSDLNQVLAAAIGIFDRPNLIVHHIMDRFHDMDSLIFIIRDTPETMDFQMGKTIAPLFVAWIPRVLWPDKPVISFAKIFGETYYAPWFAGTGTAPSPTIIGDAYINFHVGGMLWIALASGILLRTLYEYLIHRSFGPSGVFVYVAILPFLLLFWESDIAGLLSRAGSSFLMAVTISLLLAKRKG